MFSKMTTMRKLILGGVVLLFMSISCTGTTLVEMNGSNTPQLSWQDSSLAEQLQRQGVQVQATDQLKVVIRVDKLFKFPSSTQLQSSQNETLSKVAALIKSYGDRVVTVSGHTDNVGSDEAKLQRSRDQANAVAAYLWSRGIPLKNITVLGCGDSKPVADNNTLEGSAANRRIEISIG